MIEVKNLTKKYGNHKAVDSLSFKIGNGKIYGLLGPNGAGKSTTMNMLTGCLAPTEGSIKINGFDIFKEPMKAKRQIGYLPEIPPLYTDMTPYEYLTFVAQAKGVPFDQVFRQVEEVMDLTQIIPMKDRLIKNLSKGYRQRVGIAQALLGNPDIVILDEPTVGLDPRQILEIRSLVRKLGEFKTVIISSHILSEISELCEHVLVLSNGRLVANDSLEALLAANQGKAAIRMSFKGNVEAVHEYLDSLDEVESYCVDTQKASVEGVEHYRISLKPNTDPRDKIVLELAKREVPVVSIELEEQTLESLFLELTDEPTEPSEDEASIEETTEETAETDDEAIEEEKKEDDTDVGNL